MQQAGCCPPVTEAVLAHQLIDGLIKNIDYFEHVQGCDVCTGP